MFGLCSFEIWLAKIFLPVIFAFKIEPAMKAASCFHVDMAVFSFVEFVVARFNECLLCLALTSSALLVRRVWLLECVRKCALFSSEILTFLFDGHKPLVFVVQFCS